MTLVQIVKDWSLFDILRQTPGRKGIWDSIQFTCDPVDYCDYVVVLNRPKQDLTVCCPPQHVWAVMQEPPNEMFGIMHRGDPSFAKIFTTDEQLRGTRYSLHQPALAWYVNRDYDFLSQCSPPEKTSHLSWITSNEQAFTGHRQRLHFLTQIQKQLEFDLYGRGFNFIEDKWDGLAPYKYSLAIENFSNNYYWSEKIVDCFLAWTMPIYYGCKRISEYFPAEAMIQIDIHDPQVYEKIHQAVKSDLWRRNIDAIAEARRLALDRHQLFQFLSEEIRDYEMLHKKELLTPQQVFLPRELRVALKPIDRIRGIWRSIMPYQARQRFARIRQIFERK